MGRAMRKYLDKKGQEIKVGMTIMHDNGEAERVYANADENDMGIMASMSEIYPLSEFHLSEWVIVDGKHR